MFSGIALITATKARVYLCRCNLHELRKRLFHVRLGFSGHEDAVLQNTILEKVVLWFEILRVTSETTRLTPPNKTTTTTGKTNVVCKNHYHFVRANLSETSKSFKVKRSTQSSFDFILIFLFFLFH